jgi:hypothetical protein
MRYGIAALAMKLRDNGLWFTGGLPRVLCSVTMEWVVVYRRSSGSNVQAMNL